MKTINLKDVQELQQKYLNKCNSWRKGQAYFNALHDLYPYWANKIKATELDMFYNDNRITQFENSFLNNN